MISTISPFLKLFSHFQYIVKFELKQYNSFYLNKYFNLGMILHKIIIKDEMLSKKRSLFSKYPSQLLIFKLKHYIVNSFGSCNLFFTSFRLNKFLRVLVYIINNYYVSSNNVRLFNKGIL
jgi:hypothetical protein